MASMGGDTVEHTWDTYERGCDCGYKGDDESDTPEICRSGNEDGETNERGRGRGDFIKDGYKGDKSDGDLEEFEGLGEGGLEDMGYEGDDEASDDEAGGDEAGDDEVGDDEAGDDETDDEVGDSEGEDNNDGDDNKSEDDDEDDCSEGEDDVNNSESEDDNNNDDDSKSDDDDDDNYNAGEDNEDGKSDMYELRAMNCVVVANGECCDGYEADDEAE